MVSLDDDDIGHVLRDAYVDDADDEAICLAKAAHIISRDMLGIHTYFDGSFPDGCHKDAVPMVMVMVMDGHNIKTKYMGQVMMSYKVLFIFLILDKCES